MPFKKGQSGNPKGRPPKTKAQKEFEQLCKECSPDAFQTLLDIMASGTAADRDRIKCAETILAYAYGKPKQMQVIQGPSGEQGSSIRFTATIDPRAKE